MAIKFDISTTFWISNLINNTILHFSNIILIKKVISLSGNFFIFFTTIKMLLMNFISQISSLLNLMSIFVQFLAVNTTIPAQILPKISLRFSKYWNLNKISVKSQQGFYCFNKELFSIRFCSNQSCPYLISSHLVPPHLVT